MIGKAKSISHTKNSIDYALNKENAELIDKGYVVGENGSEITQEFNTFQSLNNRCSHNTISIVLSPEINEGKKLTNEDLKGISRDFLNKMNLKNNQYIVVKHVDKAHKHLHIYVNRVDFKGNAYKDNFIGKKSQKIADLVAKERGLTRVYDVQKVSKEQTKNIRKEIYKLHNAVLENKPNDLKEYKDLMKNKGVKVNYVVNNSGEKQGFRVGFKGYDFKASEVHRKMSINAVNKGINKIKNISLER